MRKKAFAAFLASAPRLAVETPTIEVADRPSMMALVPATIIAAAGARDECRAMVSGRDLDVIAPSACRRSASAPQLRAGSRMGQRHNTRTPPARS
jgi:hypothetical protein